jgi:hypothetical protein
MLKRDCCSTRLVSSQSLFAIMAPPAFVLSQTLGGPACRAGLLGRPRHPAAAAPGPPFPVPPDVPQSRPAYACGGVPQVCLARQAGRRSTADTIRHRHSAGSIAWDKTKHANSSASSFNVVGAVPTSPNKRQHPVHMRLTCATRVQLLQRCLPDANLRFKQTSARGGWVHGTPPDSLLQAAHLGCHWWFVICILFCKYLEGCSADGCASARSRLTLPTGCLQLGRLGATACSALHRLSRSNVGSQLLHPL